MFTMCESRAEDTQPIWGEFTKYLLEANAPALPETLRLYEKLKELGIKPVILTGRREDKRSATKKNLEEAGYLGYEKLLMKYAVFLCVRQYVCNSAYAWLVWSVC